MIFATDGFPAGTDDSCRSLIERVCKGYSRHYLAVSPAYGRFLYAVARACKAQRIVEFGTSMGVSTIYLAAALRDNGGGQLIGSELEPTKAARARSHLDAAGLLDLVDIREGDALDMRHGTSNPGCGNHA